MAGSINKPKKPKSKRTPVRLRNKIIKASAAKQRKQKKLAKKNPEWRSKLKKDPGIPNLFPYKEKLLQQIEDDRVRRKDEQQRRRELAKARKTAEDEPDAEMEDADEEADGYEGVDNAMDDDSGHDDEDDDEDDDVELDGSNPMAALVASARRAAEQYKRKLRDSNEMDDDEDEDDEQDEEGEDEGSGRAIEVTGTATSRKAFDKVFKEVVEQADVVLYVLDARDAEGTRSQDVERSVMASASGGKRLILVLNKADLVPTAVLQAWLTHLRRYFPTLPLQASKPAPNAQTFQHPGMTMQSTSGALFRALKAFAANGNLKRAISVGVIGYPNVGKSSVINALLSRLGGQGRAQHKACPAGAEAGVTTAIRAVKMDSKLTLLDSPGIVFPSTTASASPTGFRPKNKIEAHAHLVLLNAVPPRHIDDPVPAVTLLLQRLASSPELLQNMIAGYGLPPLLPDAANGHATTDFLVQVARKRGRLGRGGVPNIRAAAMTVVTDWRDGRIQGWAEAPVLPVVASGSSVPASAVESVAEPVDYVPNYVPMADQKEIVTQWAREFKIEGLWGDEQVAQEIAQD